MAARQSEIVQTGFGQVEVHRWGPGGRPLVLLHAAATGPKAYAPLAERLAEAGWQCLVPALHGYGNSRVPGAATAVEAHAAIATWLAEVSGARALVGHSMGGLAGLLAAPSVALDRLVLFEPILFDALDPEADADLIAAEAEMAAEMQRHLADGRDEDAVRVFVGVWNDTPWADLPEAARARLTAQAAGVVADTQATGGVTIAPEIWTAAPPTTLIHGDRSPEIARRMVAGAMRHLPRAAVTPLSGVGHMGPLMRTGPVAEAILAALP
ncbi:alpha/beta fold hydrolase [Thalassobaculum salexigens]|uniref:alpha/beta fold hydrolase n=1 Tax=Thalassobaculum salexigens TaxID=455360 RepID=UPI00248F1374|nr:alpha/beta hydrolase [Thalassobaculum salexigens]